MSTSYSMHRHDALSGYGSRKALAKPVAPSGTAGQAGSGPRRKGISRRVPRQAACGTRQLPLVTMIRKSNSLLARNQYRLKTKVATCRSLNPVHAELGFDAFLFRLQRA